MVAPAYKEDYEKDLDQLSPEEVKELEQRYSTLKDENEDLAIAVGADPEKLERGGMGRRLRVHAAAREAQAEENERQAIANYWKKAVAHDKEDSKSYYKRGAGDNKGGLFSGKNRRRNMLIGSVGLLVLGIPIAIGLSFLSVFKMDNLMSNMDQRAFARMNGNLDVRQTSYVKAYMELRLADIGDSPNFANPADSDNFFFRANNVRTGSPIRDWYKTMRLSNFEQDVFKKNGIKFTSIAYRDGKQIRFRTGMISINGVPEDAINLSDAEKTALLNGDINKLNGTLSDYVNLHDEFSTSKEARAAIKAFVNQNTDFYQVFKRRFLRKAIANVTGTPKWRFFDNTRTKIDSKKIAIRNQLIDAMLPQGTKSGDFVRCLFGIAQCQFSEDPENPTNVDPSIDANSTLETDSSATDANGKPIVRDYGPAADAIKQLISGLNVAMDSVNLTMLLDALDKVNQALTHKDLSKGVMMARAAQSIGVYQVLETARDQMKTGQVNQYEVNDFMNVMADTSNNEAWQTLVNNHPVGTQTAVNNSPFASLFSGTVLADSTSNTMSRQDYCKPAYQDWLQKNLDAANKQFGYLCPDKRIGAASNASSLENAYNSTVGSVMGPMMKTYDSARHSFVGPIVDLLQNVISSVYNTAISAVIQTLGLGKDLQNIAKWMATEVSGFLGAGPMMNCKDVTTCGNNPTSDFVNVAFEGAAASAEYAARDNGAALTTPDSQNTSNHNLALYEGDQAASQSFIYKTLSLNNPQSPASKAAVSIANSNSSTIAASLSLSKLFATISQPFASLFNRPALAASTDGYAAANFAGVQTYDYPNQCYNLDPLTAGPSDGTNALQVFARYGLSVSAADAQALDSWDTETNSDAFYKTIYDVIGKRDNSDEIAQQIYNCNLLDNTVMSGMGYVYGYTNDNGLN